VQKYQERARPRELSCPSDGPDISSRDGCDRSGRNSDGTVSKIEAPFCSRLASVTSACAECCRPGSGWPGAALGLPPSQPSWPTSVAVPVVPSLTCLGPRMEGGAAGSLFSEERLKSLDISSGVAFFSPPLQRCGAYRIKPSATSSLANVYATGHHRVLEKGRESRGARGISAWRSERATVRMQVPAAIPQMRVPTHPAHNTASPWARRFCLLAVRLSCRIVKA